MSHIASTFAWEKDIVSGSHKLALLCLAEYADPLGYSWAGVEHIARRIVTATRNAIKILHHLEDLHLIIIKPGAGHKTKSGRTNGYWLVMPGINCDSYEDLCKKVGVKPKPKSEPKGKSGGTRVNQGVSNLTGDGVSNLTGDGVSNLTENPLVDSSVDSSESADPSGSAVGAGEQTDKKPTAQPPVPEATRHAPPAPKPPDWQKRPWLYDGTPVPELQFKALNKTDRNTAIFTAICWYITKSATSPENVYKRLTAKAKSLEHRILSNLLLTDGITPEKVHSFFVEYRKDEYGSKTLDPALLAARFAEWMQQQHAAPASPPAAPTATPLHELVARVTKKPVESILNRSHETLLGYVRQHAYNPEYAAFLKTYEEKPNV